MRLQLARKIYQFIHKMDGRALDPKWIQRALPYLPFDCDIPFTQISCLAYDCGVSSVRFSLKPRFLPIVSNAALCAIHRHISETQIAATMSKGSSEGTRVRRNCVHRAIPSARLLMAASGGAQREEPAGRASDGCKANAFGESMAPNDKR